MMQHKDCDPKQKWRNTRDEIQNNKYAIASKIITYSIDNLIPFYI